MNKKYKAMGLKGFITIFVLILLILFYYNYYFTNISIDSDSTVTFIQAQNMIDGNFFLKNWYFSTNNFYTTSILNAFIYIFIFGFKLSTMKICSIITYVILLILGCQVSSTVGNNKKNFNCVLFFLLMVLPFLPNGTANFFIKTAYHIEAYIYCLFLLILLNKFLVFKTKKILYLIFVFTVLGVFGDNIIIYCLIIPVLMICLLKIILYKNFIYLKIGTTMLLATVLAKISNKYIMSFPGIGVISFVEYDNFFSNLFKNIREFLDFYDCSFFSVKLFTINGIRVLINLFIFLFVMYVFINKLKKLLLLQFVDQILILGALIQFSSYTFSNRGNETVIRYLVPSIIYINIIFARNFTKVAEFYFLGKNINKNLIKKVIIFLLIFSNIMKLQDPETYFKNKSNQREREIIKILKQNDLKNGYGGYWDSHVMTAISEKEISVSPIILSDQGFIQFEWLSHDTDYLQDRRFVLSPKKEVEVDWGGVCYKNIIKIFGRPIKEIEIEDVLILVYDKNLSLDIKSRLRKIYKYDELPYSNAKIEKNSLGIMKTGVQYGPYITLNKGSYHVIIEGTNLLEAQVSMTIDRGKDNLEAKNIQKKEKSLEYILNVNKIVKDFEVVVRNNSNKIVGIKYIVIEQIQNSADEKIMNTNKIVQEGKI